MTQAVVDGLLAEDDVVDVGTRAYVLAQRGCDGGAGFAAHVAVRLAQPDERFLERLRLPVEFYTNACAQLFEQAVPGCGANRAEVGEHTLLGLGELVRPELTRLLDHMTVRGRIWIGVEVRRLLVADLGELECEA